MTSSADSAERIVLKDGFGLTGSVSIEQNQIAVRSGPRVYYVGSRQLLHSEPEHDAEPAVRFSVPQLPFVRTRPVALVTRITRVTDFDKFGRRTIVLEGDRGRQYSVYQAITEVYPSHAVLRGINRSWRSAIALSEIPSKPLIAALHRSIDSESSTDRLKLAGFLIQAGRFEEAKVELADLKENFAEANNEVEELSARLRRRVSEKGLRQIHLAIDVGQFARARKLASLLAQYPVPPDPKNELKMVTGELEDLSIRLDFARKILEQCGAAAADSPHRAIAGRAMEEILVSLSPSTLSRLEPTLNLAGQPGTSDQERLALAISGWVIGPDLAQKDFALAIDLWQIRQRLKNALNAPSKTEFYLHVDQLAQETEPDVLLEMIPRLPAPVSRLEAAKPEIVGFRTEDFGELRYHVLLPPEYDRFREYPAVITLHGRYTTPEIQLRAWGPEAARHGVIVIAPEYRLDKTRAYEYSIEEHVIFLKILADARRRFAIDADRVFLSGHELGGFAAWDFGMSHPDQFSGLIPFTSSPMFYCERYRQNLTYLPLYAVEGSLNGGNPEKTRSQFVHYFESGLDAIYVEYPGRGREMFSAELPTIFAWMSRKRRKTTPLQLGATTARHSDRRFYWLEADSFLPGATIAPRLFDRGQFRPATLQGTVTNNNAILVTTTGLGSVDVLIGPKLVQLDDPDLSIRVNRKLIHRGPIEPDPRLLLSELRRTGDRKNLFVKRLRMSR